MTINISKNTIKNPTMICGFQGSSIVGPITVQYLLDHVAFQEIGQAWFDSMVPFGLVLKGELVKPMSIFYNKEYNLVLIRTTVPSRGIEWQLAETIENIAKTFKAKEVICIDGVESAPDMKNVVYLSNTKSSKSIEKLGAQPIVN